MCKIEPRITRYLTEFTVQDVKNSCDELSNLTYDQAMAVCDLLSHVYRGVSKELLSKLDAVQDSIESLNYDLDEVSDNLRVFKHGLN